MRETKITLVKTSFVEGGRLGTYRPAYTIRDITDEIVVYAGDKTLRVDDTVEEKIATQLAANYTVKVISRER